MCILFAPTCPWRITELGQNHGFFSGFDTMPPCVITLARLARPENRWMEFSVGTDRLYANAAAAAHVAEAGGDLRVRFHRRTLPLFDAANKQLKPLQLFRALRVGTQNLRPSSCSVCTRNPATHSAERQIVFLARLAN